NELHRDVPGVADLAELVDARDVRVGEARGDARLVEEEAEEARVLGEVRENSLHHDLPEVARSGEKHLAHAACAEAADELELAEALQARETLMDFRAQPGPESGENQGLESRPCP